jgi:hypothetical protein
MAKLDPMPSEKAGNRIVSRSGLCDDFRKVLLQAQTARRRLRT